MRYLWAAICFVMALLLAVISWMPLSKLFEDERYKDSSDGLFLLFGLPILFVGVLFLVAAVVLIWPRQR